jgi:cytochrome P450
MLGLTETADVRLDEFVTVREALRNDDLRQALYHASPFMTDALINLHGDMHRRRRRAEQPIFSREALAAREVSLVRIGEATLAPHVAAGRVELMQFGREVAANVARQIAGIDVELSDPEQTTELVRLITAFSEIATVGNSTRDPASVRRDAEAAWQVYLDRYLDPSIERRRRAHEAGDDAEQDIVTTMLRQVGVTEDALRREATLYMTATVGTAPGVLTATFEELRKRWMERPQLRDGESADVRYLQRAAWEAIRLHPANPQHLRRAHRKVVLSSGQAIEKDQLVYLDVIQANRDRAVFGPTADVFDPDRSLPPGIAPWGLGFGAGIHVCMGQNLAGGTDSLIGMLSLLLRLLYKYGPAVDPTDPPELADGTTRRTWARYPLKLDSQRVC